jgi:hypothetical protein
MKPLADSFFEKFFGKEMKLSSSGFAPEFKNFLQGIDTYVVKWAKATGNVNPDLLLNARKSAIAAFIATRGITPIMRDQLVKDKNYESGRLDILNGYLNTVMTTQTNDFYYDIMSNAKNQDEAQEKLINAHKKGSALNQREKSLESRRENARGSRERPRRSHSCLRARSRAAWTCRRGRAASGRAPAMSGAPRTHLATRI